MANVDAIRMLRALEIEQRAATSDERLVLARWSSWGAIPDVFDHSKWKWDAERQELKDLLSNDEWAAAERTTINAHYTDPLIARQMWRALDALGFSGGRVLEPGSGAGTFIGLAPESARMTGVELDPITAALSRALYPHAEVRTESFAATKLPPASFDAAIGNVPFADVKLHDPIYNAGSGAGRHSMHNHFLIKSLALTRPGGLVVALTSHYTLDAQNPGARRAMSKFADLLGAVRLPTGAHRRAAGTEVVTDLLLFRRRADGEPHRSPEWEHVVPIEVDGQQLRINTWFDNHPDFILGQVGAEPGLHGATSLTVRSDLTQLEADLTNAVDQVTWTARRNNLTMTPATTTAAPEAQLAVAAPDAWEGSLVDNLDGSFSTVVDGALEPVKVPKNAATELRALLGLRDQASRLLTLEAATLEDTEEITNTRAGLKRDYQHYVGRWGPVNRYTLRRTGRTDENGDDTHARIVPTAVRLLRTDPFGPLVIALEQFDDVEQVATPAAIMTHRVVTPRPEAQGVDTPAEAVAVSLDRSGRIDLSLIADLLGLPEDDARAALAGLVFTEPTTGRLIHAPEYLSGDVRVKLDQARGAAQGDPAFEPNVTALESVMPPTLGADEITPKLGAVWISADVHQAFLNDLLRTEDVKVENPLPGMWEVRGGRAGLLSTSEWGTVRRPATDIAQAVMEQRAVLVHDEVEDIDGRKRRVLNPVETTAAQEKADALAERFADWAWEDPERARGLVEEYNRRFNSIVLRDYTEAGNYLTLPGMAEGFTPRKHQRAAVARMIAEPAAGLFHEVGAGKTAEMIMGATEMRRMGLITKPVLVVPNHMREQFTREWLQIYPQARVLAASSSDLTASKRREFIARVAANDWDGIVMTQTAFAKIPLRPQTEVDYIKGQVAQVRSVLDDAKAGQAMSVKRIQRKLLKLEEKLKTRLDVSRDEGVCFEDSGIDYVVVDELHLYKNLATESHIQDAAIDGSARAADLHMKLEYLRSTGRTRVVTGATATPIANSITEAYIMQRYLRPDLLEAAGIGSFDGWAATFGQTVTQMEMAPAGNGYRLKTRFAKFQNVPEMLRMWSVFADVKTAADLDLPTPALTERPDGQRAPQTVPVEPTAELERFIASLGDRAEAVANKMVTPEEDNMLTISTDGRKAALDIRMVLPDKPSGPTKVDVAAEGIARIWARTRDTEYLDTITGQPSPVRGGLQLVFCDIGTPNPDKWNAYDELALQLVERGVPGEQIRYMHEAATDTDKARLFAAARAGHVAVLIGSTSKMGVGTNVQSRAVALWHMDCPWRPADLAQRDGRVIRQGNQNPEVAIVRVVTERSFDSYMWQTVERKAHFIAQVMRGSVDSREIDEIDPTTLSAAEAKAISSGNPLLLEHSTLTSEVARLRRLQRAHERNESMLHHTLQRSENETTRLESNIKALETALPGVTDLGGDHFRITLEGATYTSRADAAHALERWIQASRLAWAPSYNARDYGVIGQISGFDIQVTTSPAMGLLNVTTNLANVPGSGFTLGQRQYADGGIGLIQRIENRVSAIPTLLDHARADLDATQRACADAEQRIGQPFKHDRALKDAEHQLGAVEAELAAMQQENRETPPGAAMPARVEPNAPVTVRDIRDHDAAPRRPAMPQTPEEQAAPPSTAPTHSLGL